MANENHARKRGLKQVPFLAGSLAFLVSLRTWFDLLLALM